MSYLCFNTFGLIKGRPLESRRVQVEAHANNLLTVLSSSCGHFQLERSENKCHFFSLTLGPNKRINEVGILIKVNIKNN